MGRPAIIDSILSDTVAKKHVNGVHIRSMGERITDALKSADIESFMDGLIRLHGTNIIFGDAGIGKSAFSMWMFNELAATGKKVLYFDFEISDQQLKGRYSHAIFNENFYCATPGEGGNLLDSVITAITNNPFDVYIIDNITYLLDNISDPEAGGKFIKQFNNLIKESGGCGFLLAHKPKGQEGMPLEMSSVAGTKRITDLITGDIIGIGKSYNEASFGQVLYLKHVKCRNGEVIYHEKNIMLREFRGMFDFPVYESGIGDEHNHVKKKYREIGELTSTDKKKLVVQYLKSECGYSKVDIHKITNISRVTIDKYIT